VKGAIGGAAGVFMSHPFDTVKTHKQKNMPVEYNLKFLYRGIKIPTFWIGIEKASVFFAQRNVSVLLDNKTQLNNVQKNIISGGVAGICAAIIAAPNERIKVLQQLYGEEKGRIPREMYYPKSLYKGFFATTTREVPGFAIYFTVFELIKQNFYNGKFTVAGSFLAGGISGSAAWIFIYPQDRIKTIIQANTTSEKHSYLKIFGEIKKGGIRKLYHGFEWALLRAFFLHAGVFSTMTLLGHY